MPRTTHSLPSRGPGRGEVGKWYEDQGEERLSPPLYQFTGCLVLFLSEELVSWGQGIKNSHFQNATCL